MRATPQTCPDVGAWRAWLDHEADLPEGGRHLDLCPACRQLVDQLQQDAAFAHANVWGLRPDVLPNSADVAVARERVQWRRAATETAVRVQLMDRVSTPWRVAAGGLAAALAVAFLVAFTPEGSAAAAGFLAQFRSQSVQPIAITPQSQADIVR